MAMIWVQVDVDIEQAWEKEYQCKGRRLDGYGRWVEKTKCKGRPLAWDEYTPLALPLLSVGCKDDQDAVVFKLTCL